MDKRWIGRPPKPTVFGAKILRTLSVDRVSAFAGDLDTPYLTPPEPVRGFFPKILLYKPVIVEQTFLPFQLPFFVLTSSSPNNLTPSFN